MKKLKWPGGKTIKSFTIGKAHLQVLKRLAISRATKDGTHVSASGALRDVIQEKADSLGWRV